MGKKSREKKERPISTENVFIYKSKLERVLLKVVEWGTYLVLLTPLVVNSNSYYPFVVPKAVFFRILVDVILVAYLLLLAVNKNYKPKMNWLSWSVLGFFAVTLVSSILGENFTKSFWGTFERMTGVLTFAHLTALFFVLISIFKERKYWDRIMTICILIGVVLTSMVFLSNDPATRGGGTLGNTSFMSAYIIFDIFFAIILLFIKKGWWKFFYGTCLAIMLFLLLFPPREPTIGAIGAFFGGIALLSIIYFIVYSICVKSKKLKTISFVLLAVLILLGIAFSQTPFLKDKLDGISKTSSWRSRVIVWDIGIEAFKEKPLLGWGEENFSVPFAQHYRPELAATGDLWYDKAHNIVVDRLAVSGIVGLISYLLIFIIAVISLFNKSLKVSDKRNLIIPLGMISLLAVYFVQNMWVFDMIASYLMFFISLAFIYFLTKDRKEELVRETQYPRLFILVFGILIVTAFTSVYWCNIRPLQAAYGIIEAKHSGLEKSISVFNRSAQLSPIARDSGAEQFSIHISEYVFDEKVDINILAEGFLKAEERLKEAAKNNPNSLRLHLILGKHYNTFYNITKNQETLEKAETTLKKAKTLSPRNQQVYWELAQTELYKGNREESFSYLQYSIDLDPTFSPSYWYTSLVYRALKDFEPAWEYMKMARDRGFNWNGNLSDLIKVISVNQQLENHNDLISLYEAALKLDPTSAKLAGGMAISYVNLGAFEQASQMAKEAIRLDPTLAEDLEPIVNLAP